MTGGGEEGGEGGQAGPGQEGAWRADIRGHGVSSQGTASQAVDGPHQAVSSDTSSRRHTLRRPPKPVRADVSSRMQDTEAPSDSDTARGVLQASALPDP